ncbi:MAG: hypothetical protein USCAAHI_01072 [Beijerinckiaceae bacterium]|nr:MAG: hypothetical protein USCAAHI_01072 [Beijerinckiaceae bacterium]
MRKFAALDLVDNFRSSMIADFYGAPHCETSRCSEGALVKDAGRPLTQN